MWRRITVPPLGERIIGFSIPREGEVLVISYEGVILLRLGDEITAETDKNAAECDIYDPNSGVAQYRGKEYHIIGLHGGSPIIESHAGECLALDGGSETLSVVIAEETAFSTEYTNFSGDWAAATFSPDGRYIILGCPYDFDLVVLKREAAT